MAIGARASECVCVRLPGFWFMRHALLETRTTIIPNKDNNNCVSLDTCVDVGVQSLCVFVCAVCRRQRTQLVSPLIETDNYNSFRLPSRLLLLYLLQISVYNNNMRRDVDDVDYVQWNTRIYAGIN